MSRRFVKRFMIIQTERAEICDASFNTSFSYFCGRPLLRNVALAKYLLNKLHINITKSLSNNCIIL